MIKLGTFFISGPEAPADRLRIIKSAGFDQICTDVGTIEIGPRIGVPRELYDKVGLEIQHIHLTGDGTNHLWSEGEEGDKIEQRFMNEIEKCHQWGVKVGVLHALWGTSLNPAPFGETGLRRFERLTEYAEKKQVILALENSVWDQYFCYLLDNIKSDYFRFCFDSGHYHYDGLDMDILAKYGNRLAATHLHDNDGERDIHMMALDGTIDWEATAKSLAKCPSALKSLVSETSGSTGRKMGGKSAAEIEEIFKNTKSYRDGVLDISDNLLLAYRNMSYEEKFDRLYKNMRTIADMVEAAAKAETL